MFDLLFEHQRLVLSSWNNGEVVADLFVLVRDDFRRARRAPWTTPSASPCEHSQISLDLAADGCFSNSSPYEVIRFFRSK